MFDGLDSVIKGDTRGDLEESTSAQAFSLSHLGEPYQAVIEAGWFKLSTAGLLDPVLDNDSLAVGTHEMSAAWRFADPRRSAIRTEY